MKSFITSKISPEVIKAVAAGYTHEFVFTDGFLCCEHPEINIFLIKDVQKIPVPDIINQMIVYYIETPTGLKGYAITDWEEDP